VIVGCYFSSGKGMKYCDEYVCTFVCLSARITPKPHGRISQFLCILPMATTRSSSTLRTSGFADGLMLSHNVLRRIVCIPKQRQITTNITAEIPSRFCSAMKTGTFGSTHCNCRLGAKSTVNDCPVWSAAVGGALSQQNGRSAV